MDGFGASKADIVVSEGRITKQAVGALEGSRMDRMPGATSHHTGALITHIPMTGRWGLERLQVVLPVPAIGLGFIPIGAPFQDVPGHVV